MTDYTKDAHVLPYPQGVDRVAIAADIQALATKAGIAISAAAEVAVTDAKQHADKEVSTALTAAKTYADGEVAKDRSRLSGLESGVDELKSSTLVYGNGFARAAHVPDAATLGLWSFDETLTDASGRGRALTQYSTLGGSYTRTRRFGSHALGGGIYQNVGVDSALTSTGTDGGMLLNGTVECWIKTATPTTQKVAVSHLNWYWLGVTALGKPTARYGFGSTEKSLAGTTTLHGVDLATAPWHHLALVFNNGVASLYVNGRLEDTNTATAVTRADVDGGFTIGGIRSVRNYDWWTSPGCIDEVRVSSIPRYTPESSYPPRPVGLRTGGALFIGPALPASRLPFDQWIRTETV